MSRNQRRNNSPNQNRRQQQQRRPAPIDVWSKPGALPEMEPIAIAPEVGAVLRSLGDPPTVNGTTAGEYFAEIVERAAAIAAALALSADVLDQGDRD
jgi:hypothetical protein